MAPAFKAGSPSSAATESSDSNQSSVGVKEWKEGRDRDRYIARSVEKTQNGVYKYLTI
jgi:hypothetical protein